MPPEPRPPTGRSGTPTADWRTPQKSPLRVTPARRGPTPIASGTVQRWNVDTVLRALAVLQALWFAIAPGPTVYRLLGVVLGVASVAVSGNRQSDGRPMPQGILAVAMLLNIGVSLVVRNGELAFRLFLVVVVVAYLAAGVASTLVRVSSLPFPSAFRRSIACAIPVLLLEVLAGQPKRVDVPPAQRPVVPQPAGDRYAPNTTATTEYAENPRGYFSTEADAGNWVLVVRDDESAGELLRPDEDPSLLQVRIDRVSGTAPWELKIERRGLKISRNVEYRLSFKARARATRQITYLMWSNALGSANSGLTPRAIRVDTTWRGFSQSFRSTASDSGAILLFELGQDTADVELEAVQLVEESTGVPVGTGTTKPFAVSFRFDSIGCRGPDYAVSRDPGIIRVLALGDSYTLGAGVHERDTYAARLAGLLNDNRANAPTRIKYEVINCGIAGYGIAEAEKLYMTLGRRLDPDIVVLALVPGDDQPGDYRVAGGLPPRPWPIEHLFSSIARLRLWRAAKGSSPQSVDRIVEGVEALRDSVSQDGARLAVLVFDDGSTAPGRELEQAALDRMRGPDLPVTSLSNQLRVIAQPDRVVHEHLDQSPNDVAHGVAANEIYRLLSNAGILTWAEESLPLRRGL